MLSLAMKPFQRRIAQEGKPPHGGGNRVESKQHTVLHTLNASSVVIACLSSTVMLNMHQHARGFFFVCGAEHRCALHCSQNTRTDPCRASLLFSVRSGLGAGVLVTSRSNRCSRRNVAPLQHCSCCVRAGRAHRTCTPHRCTIYI